MLAELIINQLKLQKHPEGGYFRETYRSKGEINFTESDDLSGNRNYSTCIYFLLTSEQFSSFHRIKQDEIWHFYSGSAIRLFMISPQGDLTEHIIGNDLLQGQNPQLVVPANHWFAAEIVEPNSFALVGCTVAPGFDFSDFELANRQELSIQFPQHQSLIEKLTRE